MQYVLMRKNIPVMEIEIDEYSAAISKTGQIINPAHIPVGISMSGDRPDRRSLNEWWTGRAIPASRSGIRDALEILNVPYTQMLLTKCYGLSLSDQYWVNPADNSLNWDKVNFFNNPFSEDVGNALFGKATEGAEISLISPDNTSDGWLRKKWKIIDGKRCLIKGGSDPAQQEPLNEALATAVMRRLGIDHVPYTVIWDDGLPYSVCEDFITPQTELVSASHIMQTQQRTGHISKYQHFSNCCEALGIPGAEEHLNFMLTLDYLIVNEDRHFNNFGAVRDAETLEWQGFSPIFDSGTSLWHDHPYFGHSGKQTPSKPFRDSHTDQIELVTNFDWLDIDALDGIEVEFANILADNPRINEERREILCQALSRRVEMLDEVVQAQGQEQGGITQQ